MRTKWLSAVFVGFVILSISGLLGFENKKERLVVYLMPHTGFELDANKTFEQNYVAKVKPLLDSIFKAMKEDYGYKFNWAETVFFKEWYQHLSSKDKTIIKDYIKEKGFYFVNGASVESLSSSLHPYSLIELLSIGNQFLASEFGIQPHIYWDVNSEGSSAVLPTLLSEMNYDVIITDYVGSTLTQDL